MAEPRFDDERSTPYDLEESLAFEQLGSTYANYKELVIRAADVFGDKFTASRWLSTPCPDLDWSTPISVAKDSGYKVESLERLFLRIEHGIYY